MTFEHAAERGVRRFASRSFAVSRIYIPAVSAEQWAQFLAEPSKHWRSGYSARALAYAWQEANGFPAEIQAAFDDTAHLRGIELLLAIPEHQVPLPGGSRPSQNDVWVLAKTSGTLVSIAVEGKVSESFGPTLGDWLADASTGKLARLAYLRKELGLPESLDLVSSIRYQLLHRTASAIIEAKRFGARHAVMLVHSFDRSNERFGDYAAFASILKVEVAVNKIVDAGKRGDIQLSLGWICGDAKYLDV